MGVTSSFPVRDLIKKFLLTILVHFLPKRINIYMKQFLRMSHLKWKCLYKVKGKFVLISKENFCCCFYRKHSLRVQSSAVCAPFLQVNNIALYSHKHTDLRESLPLCVTFLQCACKTRLFLLCTKPVFGYTSGGLFLSLIWICVSWQRCRWDFTLFPIRVCKTVQRL